MESCARCIHQHRLSDRSVPDRPGHGSAIITFRSECWSDKTLWIPYLESVLSQLPPAPFIRPELVNAALTIPNIASATVTGLVLNDRTLLCEIDVRDKFSHLVKLSFVFRARVSAASLSR